MTTSRQSIRTLITDLSEVLAWGEAAEAANAGLVAERDAAIINLQSVIQSASAKDAEIAQIDAENDALRLMWATNEEHLTAALAGLAEKDATIAAKDAEIAKLDAECNRIAAELVDSFDEIERLKAELSIFKTGGASPGNGET